MFIALTRLHVLVCYSFVAAYLLVFEAIGNANADFGAFFHRFWRSDNHFRLLLVAMNAIPGFRPDYVFAFNITPSVNHKHFRAGTLNPPFSRV
ncbi:hypothetical protein SAMN05216326_1304 [Nitrosomonas marina]|uniref:Uncharacterized protein n=1 Tax=Nitrosomonas marina TaxID=917 RepID=A0A1I0EU49_9PROT|nr:hypothetical protein SAMN05216326_1304 [Nitrosomonas marina]